MCVYVIWGSCVYVLYIFMYQKFKVEEGWGVWLCVCVFVCGQGCRGLCVNVCWGWAVMSLCVSLGVFVCSSYQLLC